MIVVLEGPDGVGKTSLAHWIKATIGDKRVEMKSFGPPGDDPMQEYLLAVQEAEYDRNSCRYSTVFDRLHVGELVYGPIFRGGSGITVDDANRIDSTLSSIGALTVHCTAPAATVKSRLMSRDGGKPDSKSGASVEHVEAVRRSYIAYLGAETGGERVLTHQWMVVDTTGRLDSIATAIVRAANRLDASIRRA